MSLNARFALVLALLLGGLGIAIAWAGRYASELYFHEVNQRLNASIAMYVVERLELLNNGEVNPEALKVLAERAMTINPSVEVYLLDTQGRVIAHALPDTALVGAKVDLQPVHRFLARQENELVLGDDPRASARKAFSAFPIESPAGRQGYLYVVLGGAMFEAAQAAFYDSFIGRMAAAVLLAALLVAGVSGYLLLGRVGRPLTALARAVGDYTASDFSDVRGIEEVPDHVREVGVLKREVKLLADTIARQLAELETNDRLRRELLENLSHDLRTPLASLQGYIETLLLKGDSIEPAQRLRFLQTTHRHSQQLTRMVGQLFELAKLDSGAHSVEFESFCLAELLQDVAQDFEMAAQERGVSLAVRAPNAAAAGLVRADICLMQRVFENLLGNALRFTPSGGHIEVALAMRDESLYVEVRDSGRGIEEKMLPKVFERHIGESAGDGHSGLGLAIVRRILELHGSVISVTSRVHEGTCFRFSLPSAASA